MALQALMREPSYPFREVVSAESQLRVQYLSLDANRSDIQCDKLQAIDLVHRSAVLLELLLAAACTFEVVEEQGNTTDAQAIVSRVRALTHLSIDSVLIEAMRLFNLKEPTEPTPPVTRSAVIRTVRSTLDACPLIALVAIAERCEAEAFGHRCGAAHERLQAFLLRTDPQRKENLRVLGTAYALGAIDQYDVARSMETSISNAVAALEAEGYARDIDAIRLDSAARRETFVRIREDRVTRRGARPALTAQDVDRDVIASERIEGIDARGWM